MFKRLVLLVSLSFVALSTISCSSDDSGTVTVKNEQIAICWMEEEQMLSPKQSLYFERSFQGVISSDPLPSFDSFKINNSTYQTHWTDPGVIFFGLDEDEAASLGNLPTGMNLDVKTSIGTVSGSQKRPGLISNFKINGTSVNYSTGYQGQIGLGDQMTITWQYDEVTNKPDFIRVYGVSEFYEDYFDFYVQSTDTMLVVYNRYFLNQNTDVYIALEPYNGPNPKANGKANLSGKGTGYLYWSFFDWDKFSLSIRVGAGSKNQTNDELVKLRLKDMRKKFIKNF